MVENYSTKTPPFGEDSGRLNPRKPCSVPVNYVSQDQAYRDFIRDISVDGIFIETSRPFDIGEKISVVIPFTKSDRKVRLKGEIVRTTPDGIGVRFIKNHK